MRQLRGCRAGAHTHASPQPRSARNAAALLWSAPAVGCRRCRSGLRLVMLCGLDSMPRANVQPKASIDSGHVDAHSRPRMVAKRSYCADLKKITTSHTVVEAILGALSSPTHFSFASDRDIKIRMGQISAFGLSLAPASDRAIALSTEANPEATVEGVVTCGGQKNAEAVGPIPWAALSGDVIVDGVLVRRQRL